MNKLNSQIFLFLNELNANNNRDWFNKNKQVFVFYGKDERIRAIDLEKSDT